MQEVILVTGLPRSGTSLLMSMLEAGGIPVHSDAQRPPDQHNPKGYFEHSAVLQLASDSSWLYQAGGKAIKVLSRQIERVPPDLPARVLLMERDLQEVVQSQQRMLPPSPENWDWPDLLSKELHRLKGWLARQKWPILLVSHRQILENPSEVAGTIQRFLPGELDLKAMICQVDPNLYRNRSC